MKRFEMGTQYVFALAALSLVLASGCAARGPRDGVDDDPGGGGTSLVDYNGEAVSGGSYSEHELRAHRVGGGTHPTSNHPNGGPVPDPWKKPTGPVPDPWHGGGGSDPNPPPDPNPNPSPNPDDND